MMHNFEEKLIDMERIKFLCNMSVSRLMSYDQDEFCKHYDEIISIFCFLDQQMNEKYNSLSSAYYGPEETS